MFDISFTELMVIGAIALIVIGPERLPKVARTVGHLLGRAQRYVNDVKSDIRREVELDELRNLRNEMQDAARSFETSIHREVDEVRVGVAGAADVMTQTARETPDAASAELTGPPASSAASLPASDVDTPQTIGGAVPAAAVSAQSAVASSMPVTTGASVADGLTPEALPADPDLQLELPLDGRSAVGTAPAAPSAAVPLPPVTTQEKPGP